MIRYIIALSELGLKNHDLIFLLQNNITYIKKMFYDSSLFESHLELMIYQEYFSNKEQINNALLKADSILEINKNLNIKVTFYTDTNYPQELAKINNPPAIIINPLWHKIIYRIIRKFCGLSSPNTSNGILRNLGKLSSFIIDNCWWKDCCCISSWA